MYKRIGFVEVGETTVMDLTKYGRNGVHYNTGMIREPITKENVSV